MDADIIIENLPLLGVCNLCLQNDSVKSMLVAHKLNDNKDEVYSAMLMKCFSIDISKMDLGDSKMLICISCIIRLRDCCAFREQVEASFKTLEQIHSLKKEADKIDGRHDSFEEDDFCAEDDFGLKKEAEKIDEKNNSFADDDFCAEDDFALIDIAKVKQEDKISKKAVTEKSVKSKQKGIRNKVKYKKYSSSLNEFADTEAMLSSGLFPFKTRKNNGYTCGVCPKMSTDLDVIKNHMSSHLKKNIDYAFNKMRFSHSPQYIRSGITLRCKICAATVSNYAELKEHSSTCNRAIIFNASKYNLPFKLEKDQLDCPICKKKFLNFVSLNTHMNVHYPNFICESCGKAFASKGRLRGHVRTHEIGEFPCKYCGAVFDRVTKRENHVSKEHKAGVRYVCRRCNISMTSFYARQKHLAEVHNEELKRYKCKACPQSYITPGHLSSHVRRDHLNERNHKCDKCDQAFYTKNSLKMHMIKHDGERIHTCNVCQKSYQRKKTLREHMRIHTNDKRFVCPVCGRAFTQKCTLKGHLKVHERKDDERFEIKILTN